MQQQTIRDEATLLFDALWDAVSNPSDTIQDELIRLVDEAGSPLVDPTPADRDLLLRVVDGPPFRDQVVVTRMLVAAGAPVHQRTRDCANSKFGGLWPVLVSPEYEQHMSYDGPVSLLAE